eukprot:NODE_1418_length_606_cov_12.314183_g1129_i0.p1 GENE.NODE_1418_length_606_cov_12.314183_g1129_i0~~NODE_1418_length_606_cov_12.314183_g1129_i0.p1  ORF type:complete len:106 (+),score=4.66 NODE_1418_length_606_cov_12.314183_g1129_i0:118-435(+)
MEPVGSIGPNRLHWTQQAPLDPTGSMLHWAPVGSIGPKNMESVACSKHRGFVAHTTLFSRWKQKHFFKNDPLGSHKFPASAPSSPDTMQSTTRGYERDVKNQTQS